MSKPQNSKAASRKVARRSVRLALVGLLAMAACTDTPSPVGGASSGDNSDGKSFFSFLKPKETVDQGTPTNSTKLVDRDVEAPDVFQVTEAGLWDGRPSIGGVWVAHPDVVDPERVIIRNNANGKFVIGALFRRERAIPGPRLQVSSDAAAALSMLAGAPVELNVTALRRETVDTAPPAATDGQIETLDDGTPIAASAEVETQTLDPIASDAASAIAAAPVSPEPVAPSAASQRSALSKPYIQIGIFSVEANANRTADQMRNAGVIPTIYEQSSNGKPFWRVVVGPAQSRSERTQLLKNVKSAGFADAYAVTN
ncbi:SPOR domain-containing protein [Tritonibacter horizontis]|uniref:Sporulation related domain protein n=1 Tax=Tritonibacter horizontis TaxID=1768241 RepID=A0A132BS10_9RHOB|nr:SPOR domain-containing protein [Tritonibacter horizontis]KUP90587.1 sporulation related domain protein [Tritonibacter horizontis]